MKNLKVHIDNPSSTSITVKGRNSIKIPAFATDDSAVTLEMPDTPQIAKTLSRLRREYPSLRIDVEKLAGVEDVQGKTTKSTQVAPSGHTPLLSKDEFATKMANTAEKGSGWWDVTVDGFMEPFKVRGAKDENSAVELAYEDYLEELTSPAGE